MKRFSGRTALVTGASGGIGYQLAKLLAIDGAALVLVSRDPKRLAEARNELEWSRGLPVVTIVKDLAVAGSATEIANELSAQGRKVDILINNAGVGSFGNFHESDLAAQLRMLQLNINSLVELTGLFAPQMVKQKEGWIMNVASTAAFQPGPLMAGYYASKAFVLHFSEAIGSELAGHKVVVTAFCPGPVATGFQEAAGLEKSKLVRDRIIMDAPAAAKVGYEGMLRGQRVVIAGFKNKMLVWLVRFIPRRLVTRIVGLIQRTD